jgi:hypothetical protein
MPDYIEREAAIKMIEEDLPEVVYYKKEDAIDCLKCLPVADVVPSSEVEKWKNINEQLYKEMSERIVEERRVWETFIAKKICEEIASNTVHLPGTPEDMLVTIKSEFLKLMKKYGVEGIEV